MVDRTCEQCGKVFQAKEYRVVAGNAKYCSHHCAASSNAVLAESLTGLSFGCWTVLSEAARSNLGARRWNCKCQCGNEGTISQGALRSGQSKSCGCLKRELTSVRNSRHGLSGTPEYKIWVGMKRRCLSPAHKNFDRYGGRGITISAEWQNSFETFISDMGFRPSPGHTLERIDNDKGYNATNCRWATRKEQAWNRSTNRQITANGETLILAEWAQLRGVHPDTIIWRIRNGSTEQEAVLTAARRKST